MIAVVVSKSASLGGGRIEGSAIAFRELADGEAKPCSPSWLRVAFLQLGWEYERSNQHTKELAFE
jgi:hypothetical protein